MIIKIIIFSFLSTIYSQSLKDFKGEIKYYGEHFLHSWVGISTSIKGNFKYNELEGTASARLVVPLSSFDSKVPNRDSNMLIYTNAIDYPDVIYELSNFEFIDDSVNVIGNLTFNNVTKTINSLALIDQTDKFVVNGSLSIKLSDFKVQRPSLMFVPIDDLIRIEYYLELN